MSRAPLNAIVCGGSIAGCVNAALLSRLGFSVKVFERSTHLSERGAGIVLPMQVVNELKRLDLFDADIPYIEISERSFWVKDQAQDQREFWRQKIQLVAFNWSTIYDNLRRRVPNECYFAGREVKKIENNIDQVLVHTADEITSCDLLIAADGVNSLMRRQLYPATPTEYGGYVCWRGTLLMNELSLDEKFKHDLQYFMPADGIKGHFIMYPIPAADYAKTKNVLMNWLLYTEHPESELNSLLVDKDGKQQKISIGRGQLTAAHLRQLHQYADVFLSPALATIVTKTKDPFLQVIYDSVVPDLVNGRVCFDGDAGLTMRPHVGSGAGHAIAFALTLAEALKTADQDSLTTLLQQWNEGRMTYVKGQLQLSKNMGDALVMKTPHWSKMSLQHMEDWWAGVIQGRAWHVTDNVDLKQQSNQFTSVFYSYVPRSG